jgi:hypothetical protein
MIPKFRLTHHQLGNKLQGFQQIIKLTNHQIDKLPNWIRVYLLCKTAFSKFTFTFHKIIPSKILLDTSITIKKQQHD